MTIGDIKNKLEAWKVSNDAELTIDGWKVNTFWLTNDGNVDINSNELLKQQEELYKQIEDYNDTVANLTAEKERLESEITYLTYKMESYKEDLEGFRRELSNVLTKEYF